MAWALVWEKGVDEGRNESNKNRNAPNEGSGAPEEGREAASNIPPQQNQHGQVLQLPSTTSPTTSQEVLPMAMATVREMVTPVPNTRGDPTAPRRRSTEPSRAPSRSAGIGLDRVVELLMKVRYRHDLVDQLRRNEEKFKKIMAARNKKEIAEPVLLRMRDAAWAQAQNNAGSPESQLKGIASRALEQAEADSKSINVVSALQDRSKNQSTWENVFLKTWENVWKKCWDASWRKIMDKTSQTVWEGAIQEGLSAAIDEQEGIPFDSTVLLSSEALSSYEKIKENLAEGGTQEEQYRRIRSMFKALNLLHEATAHSVSASQDKVLDIKMFNVEVSDFCEG